MLLLDNISITYLYYDMHIIYYNLYNGQVSLMLKFNKKTILNI